MRISRWDGHADGCSDPEQAYCPIHRLIFCLCRISDKQGFVFTDCPKCHKDFEDEADRIIWEKDQKTRGNNV